MNLDYLPKEKLIEVPPDNDSGCTKAKEKGVTKKI
jgi:hypothetical protein